MTHRRLRALRLLAKWGLPLASGQRYLRILTPRKRSFWALGAGRILCCPRATQWKSPCFCSETKQKPRFFFFHRTLYFTLQKRGFCFAVDQEKPHDFERPGPIFRSRLFSDRSATKRIRPFEPLYHHWWRFLLLPTGKP